MYIIIEKDGKYYCEGRLQDGTERWEESTLREAIKSMIQFAEVSNGMKIKKRDIQFLRPVQVVKTETQYVRFKPSNYDGGRR